MARINLLKPRQVATLPIGFHSDGSNLYLRVTSETSRQWVFRYSSNGKIKQIGLGSTIDRGLTDARDVADKMRKVLANGGEPATVLTRRAASDMTFRKYAVELVEARRTQFRSEKHAKQWPATLEKYAYPVIGDKQANAVSLTDVEAILRPIWRTKTETADRVRARIETVLDYAYVEEGIERRNPATYRGNLEHRGFGPRRKISPIVHHAAAPYADIPAIMSELRELNSTTALCLRFTILTWARSGEARGALWPEIDLGNRLWSVSAHRMKAGKLHEVPLSDEAIEILRVMETRRRKDTDFVFPGERGGLVSDVGVNKVLHDLPTVVKLDDVATSKLRVGLGPTAGDDVTAHGATVHGMRSTARSWAAAKTPFLPFVLELALAHTNKDRTEAAYQRDAVLEKRQELMKAWANYCRNSNVVAFSRTKTG